MPLSPVNRVLLVQDSRISPVRRLHLRTFKKALKDAGFSDVEVFKENSKIQFLKSHSSLYTEPIAQKISGRRSNFAVLNELEMDFSLLRKYLIRQMNAADDFGLEKATVYYPRIVIFKNPEEDENAVALKAELETLYKQFINAGIAKTAITEKDAIKELIEILQIVNLQGD